MQGSFFETKLKSKNQKFREDTEYSENFQRDKKRNKNWKQDYSKSREQKRGEYNEGE